MTESLTDIQLYGSPATLPAGQPATLPAGKTEPGGGLPEHLCPYQGLLAWCYSSGCVLDPCAPLKRKWHRNAKDRFWERNPPSAGK